MTHESFMQAAIAEAKKAFHEGEVPIGAVVVHEGQIIGSGHNRAESQHDASAHAEMQAVKLASQHLQNWRLTNATLYVTLEPCLMCLGIIKLARIPRLVFGAADSRFGVLGSVLDLSDDEKLGPKLDITRGVLKFQCEALLKEFFCGGGMVLEIRRLTGLNCLHSIG